MSRRIFPSLRAKPVVRVLALFCLAALCIICPRPSVRSASASPPGSGWVQVWSDEFSGAAVDTNVWGIHTNWDGDTINVSTPSALSVAGDTLTISTYTLDGKNYTGMIQTGGNPLVPSEPWSLKYAPRYGYFESRIKLNDANGMWSMFYLQTPNNLLDGPLDPRDRGVEMDIVEHWTTGCTNEFRYGQSAIHWYDYLSPGLLQAANDTSLHVTVHSAGGHRYTGAGNGPINIGWHTYGLEWTPTYLKYSCDDSVVWTVNASPDSNPGGPGCSNVCYPPEPSCQYPSFYAPVSRTREFIQIGSRFLGTTHTPLNPPGGTSMVVDYVRHYLRPPVAPTTLRVRGLGVSPVAAGASYPVTLTYDIAQEDSVEFQRSEGDTLHFVPLVRLYVTSRDSLSYTDDALPDVQYYYRARTINPAGRSDWVTVSASTDPVTPGPVGDLSLSDVHRNSLVLTWTATGDDGTGQRCAQFEIRCATSAITDAATWASATVVATGTPHSAGYQECRVAWGLTACATYYFAMKVKDNVGHWSALSNVPHTTMACSGSSLAECPEVEPDETAPNAVDDLTQADAGGVTLALSWTSPGDDLGSASEYDLRISTAEISAMSFASARRVYIAKPQPGGETECHVIRGLVPNQDYFFALKTKDPWGNWSDVSNTLDAATAGSGVAECDDELSLRAKPRDEAAAAHALTLPSPNPARSMTSLEFVVPHEARGARLRVNVFDIAGRRVRAVVDRVADDGPVAIQWNLLDDMGKHVAPAMYMLRIDVGNTRRTYPIVVVQ